jgi:chemotaxis protein CheC
MDVSEEVLDGVKELITIGVGRSAGMLNRLTRTHVTLTVPEVCISDTYSECTIKHSITTQDTHHTSRVVLDFSGEITGTFNLIIPHISALNLVIILTGEEGSPDEMDALRVETLLEVANIIISSVMSALSILISSKLSFQYPSYQTSSSDGEHLTFKDQSDVGINARTRFLVQEKEIEGDIFIVLNRESFEHLTARIMTLMETGL